MYVKQVDEVTTLQGLDPKKPLRLFSVDADGNELYLGRHENVSSLRVCEETLITQSEFEIEQKKSALDLELKKLGGN
jgi:hypothetical protein